MQPNIISTILGSVITFKYSEYENNPSVNIFVRINIMQNGFIISSYKINVKLYDEACVWFVNKYIKTNIDIKGYTIQALNCRHDLNNNCLLATKVREIMILNRECEML